MKIIFNPFHSIYLSYVLRPFKSWLLIFNFFFKLKNTRKVNKYENTQSQKKKTKPHLFYILTLRVKQLKIQLKI